MNTTCTVRGWISEDIPELREIFAASFGDPPEVIDAFHRTFLSGPECCAVAAVPDAEKPSGNDQARGCVQKGLEAQEEVSLRKTDSIRLAKPLGTRHPQGIESVS